MRGLMWMMFELGLARENFCETKDLRSYNHLQILLYYAITQHVSREDDRLDISYAECLFKWRPLNRQRHCSLKIQPY